MFFKDEESLLQSVTLIEKGLLLDEPYLTSALFNYIVNFATKEWRKIVQKRQLRHL